MRPALKQGLLPLWRDRDTLQIGVDPRRAVLLTHIGGAAPVLSLLDGSRNWPQVVDAARRWGIPPETTNRVLALLAAGGALHDFPAHLLRALPAGPHEHLAAELATASLAYGDSDGGARTFARRAAAAVAVHGSDRIGGWVASLLSGAGVGEVSRRTDGDSPDTTEADTTTRPDLAVVAADPESGTLRRLQRDRISHLAVGASEAIGVVGPLVLPGRSTCLRCMDLTRAERDPAWPLILAQKTRRRGPQACDTVLAAMVAALAAAQALTFIDTGSAPAVRGGTLELAVPDWRWRRRTWPPHPRCPCGAA